MDDENSQIGPEGALQPLVDERALARRWQHAPRSLQRWRRAGRMPPALVVGRRVLYRQKDVETFEARMLGAAGPETGQ